MRVAFATEDWGVTRDGQFRMGGSGWWRADIPVEHLRRRGWDVDIGRVVGHPGHDRLGIAVWDGTACRLDNARFDYDVIVLHRNMEVRLIDAIRRARSAGQAVLSDVDDWYFGLRTNHVAFDMLHPGSNADENLNHYRKVLAACDAITVSTPMLADRLERLAPTLLVRNAIDLTRGWADVTRADDDRSRIGWVGATPWRSAGDLHSMRGIIGPWLHRHADRWGFFHGGHIDGHPSAADEMLIDDTVDVRVAPMATLDTYPRLFGRFDVGIVPLEMAPFNEAKSAVKGMEYAAAGVPFVATATPEYRWLAEEHGIGRVASKPRQWMRHLDALADPDVRQAEGEAARAAVKRLTIDQTGDRWVEVLEGAVRR